MTHYYCSWGGAGDGSLYENTPDLAWIDPTCKEDVWDLLRDQQVDGFSGFDADDADDDSSFMHPTQHELNDPTRVFNFTKDTDTTAAAAGNQEAPSGLDTTGSRIIPNYNPISVGQDPVILRIFIALSTIFIASADKDIISKGGARCELFPWIPQMLRLERPNANNYCCAMRVFLRNRFYTHGTHAVQDICDLPLYVFAHLQNKKTFSKWNKELKEAYSDYEAAQDSTEKGSRVKDKDKSERHWALRGGVTRVFIFLVTQFGLPRSSYRDETTWRARTYTKIHQSFKTYLQLPHGGGDDTPWQLETHYNSQLLRFGQFCAEAEGSEELNAEMAGANLSAEELNEFLAPEDIGPEDLSAAGALADLAHVKKTAQAFELPPFYKIITIFDLPAHLKILGVMPLPEPRKRKGRSASTIEIPNDKWICTNCTATRGRVFMNEAHTDQCSNTKCLMPRHRVELKKRKRVHHVDLSMSGASSDSSESFDIDLDD